MKKILGTEKRRFPRNPVQARVRITHEQLGSLEGHSRDISDGGVFVMGAALPELSPGAPVSFQLLDSIIPEITFHARLARRTADGLGLVIQGYEWEGGRFTLDVLREQWRLVKKVLS